jgi:hypothetical protein
VEALVCKHRGSRADGGQLLLLVLGRFRFLHDATPLESEGAIL